MSLRLPNTVASLKLKSAPINIACSGRERAKSADYLGPVRLSAGTVIAWIGKKSAMPTEGGALGCVVSTKGLGAERSLQHLYAENLLTRSGVVRPARFKREPAPKELASDAGEQLPRT